ncbi:hypothetical protein L7F22_061413 [Adiantum nelumboides]|nr:hypothetical protein [Adiantum nelumboides]
MEPSDVNMQREELPGNTQIPFTHALYAWITNTFQSLDQRISALENTNVQTNIRVSSLEGTMQGFNARVVTLETITQSTTARVSEGEIHLQQLQTQIATSGRSQGGPTATIPYKTTNLFGEEKECTELAVNNWIHQWTTYFDLHEEVDERRILTIPLYLRNKALTWWRDMTEKPTTWADFCTKFKKDFAKIDPLKAHAKFQSLSMKTLSFDKYTTAFKEALTFCKVDATHVHMYLLGLHEDYRWALIKDKAPTDVEDAVAKARTFHLINGANYEKKRAYDHNLSEGCTPKKKPRFQPKASKIQSRPSFDTTPRGAKEKKKAKNAMIADAVKKGACFGCGQMGHQIKDCPNKKLKKPQGRPSVHLHEISGNSDVIQVEIHHLAHSSCTDCKFSTKVFDKHDLLRFLGKINGHDVTVLLDNGSSHNFVDAKLVQKLHLPTRDNDHEYRVKMAHGEDIDVWNRMVPGLTLELADYKESLDFHIMHLDRADVILGIPWFFDKQDTLYIDYVHHSLVFVKKNMPPVSISLCNQVSVNNGFAIPIVTALEMFKDTKSSDVDFYRCIPSEWFDSWGVKGPKNSGPRRKANPPIIWNEHLDESFNKLKHLVTTAPMLHIVDPSKPFVVETDASDYALGAALYQDGRPVAFESKKLSDAEMRYPTYEKELYAVIHALKKWRHYLYGSKFIAWTDHHSLRYICDQDDLRGRKARWVELMQEFDFEIRYRKGSTNKVADALSRIPEVNALSMAEISTDFYLALRGLCRSDRHFGKVWNEVEIGSDSRIGLGDPETQTTRGQIWVIYLCCGGSQPAEVHMRISFEGYVSISQHPPLHLQPVGIVGSLGKRCTVDPVFPVEEAMVITMKELRERHLGKLQGLSRKDARLLEPEAYKVFMAQRGDEPIPGGGESLNELRKRSILSLEKISEKHLGERVVVVTHGGVLHALHHHVTGKPPPGKVLNTSINVFEISNQKVWTLQSWGDVLHLTGCIQAKVFADQDSA